MPTILEENPKNAENELLKGLRNRTVVADILNQVEYTSKILPHIQVVEIPGDTIKIVGLTSNRPKQFTWNYKKEEFGPSEAVVFKDEITDKDKKIFYSVFSEPIEKIAIDPDKIDMAVAKQANQVSYDIADFYDEEFVQEYACDLNRYHKDAIIKLDDDQLKDMQLVGELVITVGYKMTGPSTLFNKREQRVNVRQTKQLLCFVDNSLYGRGQVASTYKTPSPTLEVLEKNFTVIPMNMVNGVQLALIDSKALTLFQSLHQRYLKLDEYVASHKLLDHLWRKWVFVDYRPAFCIVREGGSSPSSFTPLFGTKPKKDILVDYAELNDGSDDMEEDQAKEWNTAGFAYKQVKDWLDIGFKVDEAKFVKWMAETKAAEDKKYENYGNPEWVLNNLGKDGHKTIDELRTEFSSI